MLNRLGDFRCRTWFAHRNKTNGGGSSCWSCVAILVTSAWTAVTPCDVLHEQHGEQCSREVAIDVMIAEVGRIQALPDQRFAEFIPCVRIDMLSAEMTEVALAIREAVCAFPQPKR